MESISAFFDQHIVVVFFIFCLALFGMGMAILAIRAIGSSELNRRQSLEAAHKERLAAQRECLEIQRRSQEQAERLNQELQEAVQDLTMLFELSQGLAATLDRSVMLKEAMEKIYESVPRIRSGMILLRDSKTAPLTQLAAAGYENGKRNKSPWQSEATVREALAVAETVVAAGQAYCWRGDKLFPASECPCTTGAPEEPPDGEERTMGMPLLIHDQVAGSLVLSLGGDSPWLTPRDLSLIRTIASQLSMALANAELYRRVQTRDALRGELLHQVVSAQERERQRVARDLHDGVGQLASALGMGLAAASESVHSDPSLAERQLQELKSMSGDMVKELQVLIAGLRPTVLDDLGLVPTLTGLMKEFEQRTGICTEFNFSGNGGRVKPDVETIIFRIAQESLTNVSKHASARSVAAHLSITQQAICLQIQDDGIGFDTREVLQSDARQQWGLIGIRERVALVGGGCDIVSRPGKGTTVQVCIPVSNRVLDV